MESTAAGGHLDVVRFLHLNRQEGCTTGALRRSAPGGHYGTFKWLQENRNEPLPPDWETRIHNWYRQAFLCKALYTKNGWLEQFLNRF